mmetsp:Transcript_83845/g.222075  ORF Transcript_83845/g.222075 Transcript_83845/m.222075 type:complete len:206 (+) Transcript_83845:103-720(+)
MLRLLLVAAFLSAASARELSQLELEPALAADDECDAVAGEPCGVQLLQARSSKESQMSSTVNSSDNMSSTEPSELPEADGPEDGEQLLQHDALVAEVQSGNFWFVSRKACGNTRGSAERLWAGQCQPALWDRSLSVRYTCQGDSISVQTFENMVCAGTSVMNKTLALGGCSDTPRPDDGDVQAQYDCVCGVGPRTVTLTGLQACS